MSQITISAFTIPSYNGGGATATIRIYALQSFLTSDNVRIFKSKPGGPVWYKSIACTVSGTVISVPQFTIDSTVDSDTPDAAYSALLFDANGFQKDYFFKHWLVPVDLGTPITFAQLVTSNTDPEPDLPGRTYTQILTAQLEANVTHSSGSGGNTPLAVTVVTGGKYKFRAVLHMNTTAGGLNIYFAGTSTDTDFVAQYLSFTTAGAVQAGGARTGNRATIVLALTGVLIIEGAVEINAGGTFLIYAEQASPSVDVERIFRGSTLELIKTNQQ